MKHIGIITGAHLWRNPRVVKEANALHEAGYQVSIRTIWTQQEALECDRSLIRPGISYEGLDLTGWNSLQVRLARLKRRGFIELQKWMGIESSHSLNYSLSGLIRQAQTLNADMYLCHQETGLAVGCQLLKMGKKAAFDLEDWYSQDLLPEARANRPLTLLEKMEKQAIRKGAFAMTTSGAMAAEMGKFYEIQPPAVLRNVFSFQPLPQAKTPNESLPLSLVWFSQTIGPGRGLEFFVQAVNQLENIPLSIHLIGNVETSYQSYLSGLVAQPRIHELRFYPSVHPNNLVETIAQYDIGLALEMKTPENKDLTISNKIFQYLQAGLAVIATDTKGQTEVAESSEGAVQIVTSENTAQLADVIRSLHQSRSKLRECQEKASALAAYRFNWDIEKNVLLGLVKEVLGG